MSLLLTPRTVFFHVAVAIAGRCSNVGAALVGTGVLLQQLLTRRVEGTGAGMGVATAGSGSNVGAALGLVGTGVLLQ